MTVLASELSNHQDPLRSRRNEVVTYLEDAAQLIGQAHDELAQGRVPHGVCEQIFITGNLLLRTIGDDVSEEDLTQLQKLLAGAHEVEILHEAVRTPDERDLNLAALDRSWGAFTALVKAIKASPIASRHSPCLAMTAYAAPSQRIGSTWLCHSGHRSRGSRQSADFASYSH